MLAGRLASTIVVTVGTVGGSELILDGTGAASLPSSSLGPTDRMYAHVVTRYNDNVVLEPSNAAASDGEE